MVGMNFGLLYTPDMKIYFNNNKDIEKILG